MTITIPLRMEIRTEEWIDGGDLNCRVKLRARVTKGRRGTVTRKRLALELLALAHMVSTA